jgi:hypothetical protein
MTPMFNALKICNTAPSNLFWIEYQSRAESPTPASSKINTAPFLISFLLLSFSRNSFGVNITFSIENSGYIFCAIAIAEYDFPEPGSQQMTQSQFLFNFISLAWILDTNIDISKPH